MDALVALATLSTNALLVAQQQNKRMLAARANQDILQMIFSVVVNQKGSAGLRAVSQVCQRWRKTALAAPLLWRKALSLSLNPNWMLEILRRTLDVPLTIHIGHQSFHQDTVYANLLSIADQFSRFETLEIEAPYPYIYEFFSFVPFDGVEAPRLRVLSLCGQNWQDFSEHDEVLPDELLALSAPNLEHLVLENCAFGWDALNSGLACSFKLSVLHICYPAESDGPHMLMISELLATLSSMTSLQELKLRNVLKAMDENPFVEWNVPTTVLPVLQTLVLQANIQHCSGFLPGVQAPALVGLDVECNAIDDTRSAPLLMKSAFMISISKIAPRDPYHTLVALHCKGKLWISLQSNQTSAFCRIVVPQVNDGLTLEYMLRKLADMSSVHSTENLGIGFSKDIHTKVTGEMWVYLFEHLNKVSSLDLGKYPVPCILQYLYRNAKGMLEAQKQGKEASILMPLLETISVAASSKLCMLVLVDMIAELREAVDAPIDRYLILRETDAYYTVRERITVWLAEVSSAQLLPLIEDDEESVGESEDFED